MIQDSSPSVAIVGSGPSGCYVAQYLRKHFKESRITIFDSLPIPYGLVRFGVAPDHLGTKAVTQQFDRLFEREGVTFIGDTDIGKDKSLTQLLAEFDIVVLALGLGADRKIGIPGENLAGVFGSGRLTRLINSHPRESENGVSIGSELVIVGQGNVAMDLIRLILMSSQELIDYGVAENVAKVFGSKKSIRIHVIGRSLIGNAKFDSAMIQELAKSKDVKFYADSTFSKASDLVTQKRINAIESLVATSNINAKREVAFYFGWKTCEIRGSSKVQSIILESIIGEKLELSADTVISAIGFEEAENSAIQLQDLLTEKSDLEHGFVFNRLYCVGWLRRGPQGTIPVNRLDAKIVSARIVADYNKKY